MCETTPFGLEIAGARGKKSVVSHTCSAKAGSIKRCLGVRFPYTGSPFHSKWLKEEDSTNTSKRRFSKGNT